MRTLTKQQRTIVLTMGVAAVGALFTEHLLKPRLKRRLKV